MIEEIEVSPEVFSRHPEYSVHLMEVRGVTGGPTNVHSDALLVEAEQLATTTLATSPLEELEEVVTWRAAFRSFGVKPRVARSSFEALLRRADKGLPRIDVLTDIYNAVSVMHRIPIGGENLDAYVGPARLTIATGDEEFDTFDNGEPVVQHPDAGEVIWRDDVGVTCRRWNWRQCVRTRLDAETTSMLFIIDGLGSDSIDRVETAGAALSGHLGHLWPQAAIDTRTISRWEGCDQPK